MTTITGLEVTNVEAKRKSKEMINNMKFNINFDSVKAAQESVEVEYTFLATYEGGSDASTVGELKIHGVVTAKDSKKAVEEIAATWEKKKNLPLQFAEDLINLLNFECGSRGTLAAYAIGFAAPLPLSKAKLQEAAPGAKGGVA